MSGMSVGCPHSGNIKKILHECACFIEFIKHAEEKK